MSLDDPRPDADFDVVVIGGALAGAASALLLLREQPRLRIAILEKSTRFTRRVGEATVEVSTYFLTRVLGLTQHLNESHLLKQGMRFWFSNDHVQSLADSSELGGRYQVRLPAYQVDRSVLDEELLRRAVEAGAILFRPAKVSEIQLEPGGRQRVDYELDGSEHRLAARWVIDASGFAAILARQKGWYRPNHAHPTAAVWARWRGVKDWDGLELSARYPEWSAACHTIRGTATNHLAGDGWWAWMIPLKGGDTSVGVVYDQRTVRWAEGGSLGQRLKDFLCAHPVGRELLADATWLEGDVHARTHLAFSTTVTAGDGFVLVGDAAGFLDPLYSPGMDWLSITVAKAVELISKGSDDLSNRIAEHNRDLARSYSRWFTAIYRDKYDYLGEFDLMRLAFRLDLGLYYVGVVSQPFLQGREGLLNPVFSTRASTPFFHFMSFYNRRLARIGRARREKKLLGLRNRAGRDMIPGFTLQRSSALSLLRPVLDWVWLEAREGWRTWRAREREMPPPKSEVPAAQGTAKTDVARAAAVSR